MRAYIQVTGLVFAAVTLAHAFRLALGWPVQVAGWAVPMWVSWLAIPLLGVLGVWALRLVARAPR